MTIKKIKIDLFKTKNHKKVFELLKPNLNITQQMEAVKRLMFMNNEQVLEVLKQLK